MQPHGEIPRDRLRENLRCISGPIAQRPIARAIADENDIAGAGLRREGVQQFFLTSQREIMQEIEKRDVSVRKRQFLAGVLFQKRDPGMACSDRLARVQNFARIHVQPGDGRREAAFAQVKRKQANPASDIEERRVGSAQQFCRRAKNPIRPQLPDGVMPEPARCKKRSHTPAGCGVICRQ